MRARTWVGLALATALLLDNASAARAESGALDLHGSFGLTLVAPPFSMGVTGGGGFDWQLAKPVAIDVSLGGGDIGLFGGVMGSTQLFFVAAGIRIRLRDHHEGYFDEPGGDLWGNWYLVPRAGLLQNVSNGDSFGTVELEAGYEFAIARPLQIGPFARVAGAFGMGDPFGYAVVGLNVSMEVVRLPESARPAPPPRRHVREPIEIDDDDSQLPDGDGDRVSDFDDACPDTRPRSKVDARGCAILAREMVLEGITFAFDSDQIEPASEESLLRAVQSLRDNPTARVEIDGHTDDVGTEAYNLKLSEERALAVAAWVVAHGINEDRLTVRGFGATQPKAPNDSDANRALNRRIEFKRLDTSERPDSP